MLKFRFLFKIFVFGTFIFLAYQLIMYIEISKDGQKRTSKRKLQNSLVLGTHANQNNFYEKNSQNTFLCFQSYEVIEYRKINDDYCDCLDATDEPGTNACPNGIFFCKEQSDTKIYPNHVSSQKVNDGICDCCDGSDEWKNIQLLDSDGMHVSLNQI